MHLHMVTTLLRPCTRVCLHHVHECMMIVEADPLQYGALAGRALFYVSMVTLLHHAE